MNLGKYKEYVRTVVAAAEAQADAMVKRMLTQTKKADSSKSSMAESQNTQSARTDELSTNSTAKIGEKSETTKLEGEIELLTTSNGMVYGWSTMRYG